MSPLEIGAVVVGIAGTFPALYTLLRDLWRARRLGDRNARITVKLDDGRTIAGSLDSPADVEQLLEALPAARELSVR
jgi:hypothetical protein